MISEYTENFKYHGGAKICEQRRFFLKGTEFYLKELLYNRGFLTLSEVEFHLEHEQGNTLENLQYGWLKEDGEFRIEMLHEGKFVLKYRLYPRQLLKLIDS